MKVLIDTHVFLWWDKDPNKLSHALQTAIADGTNDIFLSAASVWELAIKRVIGKVGFSRRIVEAASRLGFGILPISGGHAERAAALPRHHNDPFDRIIIAQAQLEGMVLGTQDRLMQPYGVVILGLE